MNKMAHIITYHNSYNYGACLQAYASQMVLEQLDFSVQFIDYRNVFEDDGAGKSAGYFLRKGMLKSTASACLHNALGYKRYFTKAFAEYHASVPKTSLHSRSITDFQNLETDLLVVGSDQMWNGTISGSVDPAFLLDFGCAAKRISLATSMGNYEFNENDAALARRCLARFDAISVRERYTKVQIDAITGGDAFVCLDPTLLLGARDWRMFARRPDDVGDEKYLLVFTVDNHPERAWRVWNRHARELGVPVYRIANNLVPVSHVDRTLRGITPQEFVWLFDHAAYVVTDSFHGTAFSVNLQTPFTVIPNKHGNNVRMTELLESVGLPERFDDLTGSGCPPEVDFADAAERLAARRAECLTWVGQQVSD